MLTSIYVTFCYSYHLPVHRQFYYINGCLVPGEGGTPYDGLYGEAPPERGIFVRPQVYERVAILLVEVYERVGKSVI